MLKQFSGDFLIYRKAGRGFRRAGHRVGAGGLPRFRHPTVEAAIAEAERLHDIHPNATFVIMQEIAAVKPAPTDNAKEHENG